MNVYRMYYYSGITSYYEDDDGIEPDYSQIMSFIVISDNEEQAKKVIEDDVWSLGGLTFYKAERIPLDCPLLVCAADDKFDE